MSYDPQATGFQVGGSITFLKGNEVSKIRFFGNVYSPDIVDFEIIEPKLAIFAN